MQGKFSLYFGKIVFLKYHFKMVFYYPFLKGDIHLGCSLCISEGIGKTSPWKNWLGKKQRGKDFPN